MSKIRYLLDENVNPILRTGLLHDDLGVTVLQVGMMDVPPLGTPDPEILIWCEENDFILVTNNRKSMPVHLRDHLAAGRSAMAIFILNPDSSFRDTIDELLLIASVSSEEEYRDQIVFLPIRRFVSS